MDPVQIGAIFFAGVLLICAAYGYFLDLRQEAARKYREGLYIVEIQCAMYEFHQSDGVCPYCYDGFKQVYDKTAKARFMKWFAGSAELGRKEIPPILRYRC